MTQAESKLIELQKEIGGKIWKSKRGVPILSPFFQVNICWFGNREVFRLFEPDMETEQKRTDFGGIKSIKRYIEKFK